MRPGYNLSDISILFCICLFSLVGCQENHDVQKKIENLLPAQVTIETVKQERVSSLIEVMGTVQAVDRAIIASRVNGHIVKLPVFLGSQVNKADLLVSISAGEITAQLLQAQAQLAQAQRNLDREKMLHKKKASTLERVKSLEDIKRIAEAYYEEAQTMLDFTRIEAPFAGTITAKAVNIGDLAKAGKPLLTLENDKSLQVIVDVPEALVLKVTTGDQLPVSIPAAKLKLIGKVTEIAPVTDPLSHTAPIKVAIDSHSDLRPGQFARVTLQGKNSDTILVPKSAVTLFGQIEQIFVANNNKAQLRLVRSGASINDKLEILSGLTPGETIIVGSTTKLTDGHPITRKNQKDR